MENIYTMYATLLMVIGALVVAVNIIVEVLKQLVPNEKFPTNIMAIIVSMILTMLAFLAYAQRTGVAVQWYHVAGAVVAGIFVAYGAMFGFDKLKEALERYRKENIDDR